jgi:predicted enzyme related to lactoylglutathione lyase
MSAGGWIWYELLTSDVDDARKFYGDVIGWKWTEHGTVPGYHMFAAPDATIGGLMAMPQETGLPAPAWLGYVHVADVDATVAAALADGAVQRVPPTTIASVGRFAMIQDPQGASVYVMTPQQQDGQSQSFAARVGHCQWCELVTSDPVAATAFYTRLMGWQKGDVMSMGPMGDYQFVSGGGQHFGAIMKRAAGRPVWRYYFGVDHVDRAAAAVVTGGGTMRNQPQQVPGGAWAAVAVDPQGVEFGISGPR